MWGRTVARPSVKVRLCGCATARPYIQSMRHEQKISRLMLLIPLSKNERTIIQSKSTCEHIKILV